MYTIGMLLLAYNLKNDTGLEREGCVCVCASVSGVVQGVYIVVMIYIFPPGGVVVFYTAGTVCYA